jgi:hypothetical protein
MPGISKRHRLVLYTYILNRWWKAVFAIGLTLLLIVLAEVKLPSILSGYPTRLDATKLWLAGGLGIFTIFLGLLLAAIRKSAFVQPLSDHLLLVTPFFRMKISYRRLMSVSSTEMGRLFNYDRFRGLRRTFFLPLASQTAVVLDLKGWPLPRSSLAMFLSPYFFPDRSSRLALLVPDWIRFSTELDSRRTRWLEKLRNPGGQPQSDMLAPYLDRQ